jgi:hypothetical protein
MPALDSTGGFAGDPAHRGVDEQCAEAGGGRYLTLQDIDMIDQISLFEPGVGQHHDGILHMITLKNRQEGKVFAFASTASHFPPGCRPRPHGPEAAFRIPDSMAFHPFNFPLPHSDFRIQVPLPSAFYVHGYYAS